MKNSSFLRAAATQPGWWSVWLELVFVVMFILNVALQLLVFEYNELLFQIIEPVYMVFVLSMLACGLAGGVSGLFATIRRHEHSLVVWLATLVGLFVLLIVVNELMQLVIYLRGA